METETIIHNSPASESVQSVFDYDVMTDENFCNAEKVDKYAERINIAYGKTVSSILELAYTVKDARQNLNAKEWKALKEKFSWESDISKLLTIGLKHDDLLPFKDNLPCAKESLYLICKKDLSKDKFAQYVLKGEINRYSTIKELSLLLGKGKSRSGAHSESDESALKVVEVDQTANVVCLVVNTTKGSDEAVERNPEKVEAALKSIVQGMSDLEKLGFAIPEKIIKSLEDIVNHIAKKDEMEDAA